MVPQGKVRRYITCPYPGRQCSLSASKPVFMLGQLPPSVPRGSISSHASDAEVSTVEGLFSSHASDADVSTVEGAMGEAGNAGRG